jgi:plastocyanin
MRGGVLVISVVCLAACGGADPTTPTSPAAPTAPSPSAGAPTDTVVAVEVLSYSPTEVTVSVGSTVTWKWTCGTSSDPDGAARHCAPHTVTFDEGTFASPKQTTGAYQRRFMEPGTYTYYCVVHPAMMVGRVVVR